MASLTDILMALGSADPAVRNPAEQMVLQAKTNDLSAFILTVLKEFQDETKPAFARNMAGTLLKNAVAPSLRNVAERRALEEHWKALAAPVRQQVKDEVLATLGNPMREVRNVAANIVGSLSRIELPAGEWSDLMQILVNAAQSDSAQHQEAALTAIGYICEEGRDHEEVEEALKPSTTATLSAIVRGMGSSNEDIRFSATNALCNAMEYIHTNMEQQDQRDYLVDAICTTAKSCVNPRTRERAMESLVKVADLYYATLPNYIARLHEITTTAIFQDEESVGLQACQFWISICENERDMKESGDVSHCLHYATQGMDFLVNICLQLLVRQEEDQSDEDWNLSIAGGKLLQALAEAVGGAIHSPVMAMVYANINSAEWREREAALMAFGCILGITEPAAQEAMQDTVAQAVPGLLQYMRDANPLVADTSAWVASVVCENYVDVFLKQQPVLQQLLNIVGPMIADPNPANARMGVRACLVIHNLALAFEEDDDDQATNELSAFFGDLTQVLLRAIDGSSAPELRSSAQETLNALVDAAAKDAVGSFLVPLVPELQRRLDYQLNLLQQHQGGSGSEEVEALVGLLCGALSALSRKMDQLFSPFIESSMTLLLRLIHLNKEFVQDEALTAIGSIAHCAKSRMEPFLPTITPYMVHALQAFDEPESIYCVVGTIGDLSLSCGPSFQPHVKEVLDVLYMNLISPNVDRDLKCSFISCLGDIILNVLGSAGFIPLMPTLLPVVEQMFEASCGIDIRGDADGEDYVMSLWESTASFYSSILQCFREAEVGAMEPYLQRVLHFVLHATAHAEEYSDTMNAALMVIGDMASVIKKSGNPALITAAKGALITPAVSTLLTRASSIPDVDASNLKWIRQQLNKLNQG